MCFNFTNGYERCYSCGHGEQLLDAVCRSPTASPTEQLHHALRWYKRLGGEAARRLTVELAAVLWRHLAGHEGCVARAARAGDAFDLVTTVPSVDAARDQHHPLRQIVGDITGPTRERHERLLTRSKKLVAARAFDGEKYESTRGCTAVRCC